jgi:hypothetical protein
MVSIDYRRSGTSNSTLPARLYLDEIVSEDSLPDQIEALLHQFFLTNLSFLAGIIFSNRPAEPYRSRFGNGLQFGKDA